MDHKTPFAHVLDTNYAPSSEEQATIKALILEPEQRIRQLEEEIADLRRFVGRHRTLLAPCRQLPADVWREIFVFYLPIGELGLCVRSTSRAPLLLTAICRTWRAIALNTPRLWNAIHIHIQSPHDNRKLRTRRHLQALRERKSGLE